MVGKLITSWQPATGGNFYGLKTFENIRKHCKLPTLFCNSLFGDSHTHFLEISLSSCIPIDITVDGVTIAIATIIVTIITIVRCTHCAGSFKWHRAGAGKPTPITRISPTLV